MKTAQNLIMADLTKDDCQKRFGIHTFDITYYIEVGLNKARDEALNRINAMESHIKGGLSDNSERLETKSITIA